ncbi:MAG: GntR family transcriptional regulator [Chloroflexi bacterium]|nr:GntR family transcriptional regulator [Chloroflexota bacterium]
MLQRPETLTSAVARFVRDAIMRGEYAPGRSLPEVWLAEQLQTSRGTIREAFRVLADQGLVETIPHRGTFVAKLNSRKAYEIYTLRAELESYAVRLAMERGGYARSELDALRVALERLHVDSTGADQFELADADMHLHELLSCGSEHQVLLDTLGSLRLQMRQFIVYTKLMGSDEEPEYVTHRRLLETVEAGDAATAAAAVKGHILEAGQLLMRKLLLDEATYDSGTPPMNGVVEPTITLAPVRRSPAGESTHHAK